MKLQLQCLIVALAMLCGIGVFAEAKTRNVANNGVDSATCGAVNAPCRSLSKAIANATEGDRIIVGPGRYSLDLDNDLDSGESGEESAPLDCHCMILVNKRLNIESRDGAAATVLDAGGVAVVDVVQIAASGVVFGKPKKGFTLTGAGTGFSGLSIVTGTAVRVEGNVAIKNSNFGFILLGNGHVLRGNLAIANGLHGFLLLGSSNQLSGNFALANSHQGFEVRGSGHQLINNLSSANGESGFALFDSGHVLSGDVSVANSGDGFAVISGSGHVLTGNSAIGNRSFGVELFASTSATISKNNIYGNAALLSGTPNCGLWNASGNAIMATVNFWGFASGPSPSEPADNICEAFGSGSTTTAQPFAMQEFKIKTLAPLDERGQLAPMATSAKTLIVANNGLDNDNCGTHSNPCRSISKAIALSSDGGKIIVGPGLYGDLDGNKSFEPANGEEAAPTCFVNAFHCMITVAKRLMIESRDGAFATVLDAGGAAVAAVGIDASGVIFGKKSKGFTLTHTCGSCDGLLIGTRGVRVEGNLAIANGDRGFSIAAPPIFSEEVLIGNWAIANGDDGFFVGGDRSVLSGNFAIANKDSGFVISGAENHLNGNLSSINSVHGFEFFSGSGVLSSNVTIGNRGSGILVDEDSNGTISKNTILGNYSFGIFIEQNGNAIINMNNIYGNNDVKVDGLANCGLRNESGHIIDARNDFWGTAIGPGFDPADNFCGGSTIRFGPVATKEFKVKTLAPLEEPQLAVPADLDKDETPRLLANRFFQEIQMKDALLFRALGDVTAVRLEVTDLSGRKIYDSGFVKGREMIWARMNSQNKPVANGVYLYQLTAREGEGRAVHSEVKTLVIRR